MEILQACNDSVTPRLFVRGYGTQQRVESSQPERIVGGNRNSLMGGFFRFQNDVTSHLVDLPVSPSPAQHVDEMDPGNVPR